MLMLAHGLDRCMHVDSPTARPRTALACLLQEAPDNRSSSTLPEGKSIPSYTITPQQNPPNTHSAPTAGAAAASGGAGCWDSLVNSKRSAMRLPDRRPDKPTASTAATPVPAPPPQPPRSPPLLSQASSFFLPPPSIVPPPPQQQGSSSTPPGRRPFESIAHAIAGAVLYLDAGAGQVRLLPLVNAWLDGLMDIEGQSDTFTS